MQNALNLAVLGSGRGSNFQAILDAIREGRLPRVRVCVVISNNSGAGILALARANGIPAVHLSRAQFSEEAQFVEAMLTELRSRDTDLVALAGYMKQIHPRVIEAYRDRIVNIHPALLPKYGGEGMYGMRVHEAVITSGDEWSGATVHFVDEGYDTGTVIARRRVRVEPGDTPESLAARVLKVEHELYPEVLRMIAEGAVTVGDRGLVVDQM